MAFTQDQLTELEKAISQGVTSVSKGDREIRYKSLDEMIRLRDAMRSELGLSGQTNGRSKLFSVTAGKGL